MFVKDYGKELKEIREELVSQSQDNYEIISLLKGIRGLLNKNNNCKKGTENDK